MKQAPARLVLLGSPVSASLSPIIQRAAMAAAGIDVRFEALDVGAAQLPELIAMIRAEGLAGNVTRPLKVAVHNACDDLTPIAKRVGAVNTFWTDGDRLIGDNTDVGGFDHAARALLIDTTGHEILVLGSGGAASAVLAAVESWPRARVAISSRNAVAASALARRYGDVARVERDLGRAAGAATLIVNATPLGQYDDEFPLDLGAVPPAAAVIDLVYRRGETPWIKALRKGGQRAADGRPMLIEQGALSFQRWFGVSPDRRAMKDSIM